MLTQSALNQKKMTALHLDTILRRMKVTSYGTIKPTTTTRRREGTSATSFSSFLSSASAPSSSSAASEVNATAALSGLLALQEISEEERKKERLVKQAKDMLDSLERLRQQLLMGEIPADMLSELSRKLSEEKQQVSDPKLMIVIEDIELRLAVEMAKLEMAFASKAEL